MPVLGFSFQPFSANGSAQESNRVAGGPQSAVQVKSFTLPNRFVPGQIAPQELLQSAGGGGQLNVNVLRQLMQMFAPPGQQPGVPVLQGNQSGHLPGLFDQGYGGSYSGAGPNAQGNGSGGASGPLPPRVVPAGDKDDHTPPPDTLHLPPPPAPPFDFSTYEPPREVQSAGDRKRAGLGLFD